MVMLGGIGSVWGALWGALFYVYAPYYLAALNQYQTIVYGALLIVVILVVPEGILGIWHRLILPQVMRLFRLIGVSRTQTI